MRQWLWKHRALLGYLFIVGATALALQLRANHVNDELNARDRVSCMQRTELARNQKLVLAVLVPVAHAEVREHSLPEPERSQVRRHLLQLAETLGSAGPKPC